MDETIVQCIRTDFVKGSIVSFMALDLIKRNLLKLQEYRADCEKLVALLRDVPLYEPPREPEYVVDGSKKRAREEDAKW